MNRRSLLCLPIGLLAPAIPAPKVSMTPSQVNDSARAMMAAMAERRWLTVDELDGFGMRWTRAKPIQFPDGTFAREFSVTVADK